MTDCAKGWLLAGLALIWGTLLTLRVLTAEDPPQAPLTFTSGATGSAARKETAAADLPAVVRPVLSSGEQVGLPTPKNIFAPLDAGPVSVKLAAPAPAKPAVPPMPVPVTPSPPPPPSPEEIAAQQERQQREAVLQQARQRMAQYRFLGYLTEAGAHRAFLAKGSDLYIVTLGETVEGQIQVAAIDQAAVTLVDLPTRLETSLPLVKEGARALAAVSEGLP